jgi:hypothetical protein
MYCDIHSSIVGPALLVMETAQSHPWLTAAGLLFCLWCLTNTGGRKLNPNRLLRPPGPKGLPFLGAMLEVPSLSQKPWLVYDKWFKKYGQPCSERLPPLANLSTRRHHILRSPWPAIYDIGITEKDERYI